MDIARKARHICIVGQSGTGKTTLGIRYLLNSHHGRIVVADHEGEFAQRVKVPLNLTWGTFYDALEKQRIACLDITEVDAGKSEETFDELCRVTLDLSKTVFQPHKMETLLVIDELQKYSSSHFVSDGFKTALETGRKWSLDTLSLSQRPNGINAAAREQFTEIFFFRMRDMNSHKFGEYFGLSSDKQSDLPDGHYIYMNMKSGEMRDGQLWT